MIIIRYAWSIFKSQVTLGSSGVHPSADSLFALGILAVKLTRKPRNDFSPVVPHIMASLMYNKLYKTLFRAR